MFNSTVYPVSNNEMKVVHFQQFFQQCRISYVGQLIGYRHRYIGLWKSDSYMFIIPTGSSKLIYKTMAVIQSSNVKWWIFWSNLPTQTFKFYIEKMVDWKPCCNVKVLILFCVSLWSNTTTVMCVHINEYVNTPTKMEASQKTLFYQKKKCIAGLLWSNDKTFSLGLTWSSPVLQLCSISDRTPSAASSQTWTPCSSSRTFSLSSSSILAASKPSLLLCFTLSKHTNTYKDWTTS